MTTELQFAQPLRLGNPDDAHLYVVECESKVENARGNARGQWVSISVDANNRNQAAAIARKAGFVVCSVNMVG